MRLPISSWKPVLFSAVNIVLSLSILWHLYTGGWLTNPYYRLNDPDIINLFVAILEPLVLVASVVYWFNQRPGFYRVLFWAFVLQCLIGIGFLAVFIVFVMTWKPRLM